MGRSLGTAKVKKMKILHVPFLNKIIAGESNKKPNELISFRRLFRQGGWEGKPGNLMIMLFTYLTNNLINQGCEYVHLKTFENFSKVVTIS